MNPLSQFTSLIASSLSLEARPTPSKGIFSRLHLLAGAALLVGAMPLGANQALASTNPVQVTVESAGVQETTSGFSSVGVENLNSYSIGAQTITTSFSGSVGSYSTVSGLSGTIANVVVSAATEYGGAGGTGKYALDTNGSITITLSKNVNYFGLWVSAMNDGNVVSLYSGSTLLYSFDTATMSALIGSSGPYYGNPTTTFSGMDSGEPFAFVNFYNTSGTFNKIVISGTGFESDNYTVGTYTSMSGTVTGHSTPNIVSDNNGTAGYNTISTLGTGNYSLRFDGGTLLIDTAGAVSRSFTLTSNNGGLDQNGLTSVFSGLFSNDSAGVGGKLIITNSGTGGSVTLSNIANSYSGGTEVDAGATLLIASANVLGSGALSLVGTATTPATLVTTANMTISNAITVTGDPVFNIATGTTTTVSSVISGSGDVEVSGGGTLALTNANTYTGPTTIDSGSTLALSGIGSLSGSSAVINNGTFDLSSASSVVTLGGTYTQSSTGSLLLSASPKAIQKISVSGIATLGGTLTLNASSGDYRIGKYYLISSDGVSGTFSAFNNNLSSVTLLGNILGYDSNGAYLYLTPNAEATLQGIRQNAKALSSAINMQSAALQSGLSYDCSKFDANNMCVSVGGRVTHAEGALSNDSQAALLILAYRPTEDIRLGAYVDQSINGSPQGLKLKSTNPMWGFFSNWAASQDGTGLNIQASTAFSSNNLSIYRSESSLTEAGQGKTTFDNQAYQLQANYVQPVTEKTALIPYLGLRYLESGIGAYTETTNSSVMFPISYNNMKQKSFAALAGTGISSRLTESLTGTVSAGLIQNLSYSMDSYSGASIIPGVTSFNVNMPSHVNTMATVSGGLSYDVDESDRVNLTAVWQQQPFLNANTTTVMMTYSLGF